MSNTTKRIILPENTVSSTHEALTVHDSCRSLTQVSKTQLVILTYAPERSSALSDCYTQFHLAEELLREEEEDTAGGGHRTEEESTRRRR